MNLSVIMPAYNEQAGIAAAVAEVQQEILERFAPAELIVVNDGSRDRTGAILDDLARQDPRLRIVHQANRGHGPALLAGLEAATGAHLFLIDSDQQIPLDHFEPLWRAAQGQDGAFGVRRARQDAPARRLLTRVIRPALTLLFGVRLHDANVPFKLMKRELWLAARPLIPPDTLAPSLFLAIFAGKRHHRIALLDVPHRDRTSGTVSIRHWKLIRFCARAFGQLLRFRLRLK
jgi:dolichol-phosphate mannosyltransferase